MNINLTLIGQLLSFAVFVWFTMKFVWTPIMGALDTRRKEIADGLAAAEHGQHEQELAKGVDVVRRIALAATMQLGRQVGLKSAIALPASGQSEVGNVQDALVINQQVAGVKVSVCKPETVCEPDGVNEL